MSKADRVFAEDWRDCLREQYRYVVRQQDMHTVATLTEVLYEVGFGSNELAALHREATLHAEHRPDDIVPQAPPSPALTAGVDLPLPLAAVDEEPEPEAVLPSEAAEPADHLLDEAESTPAAPENDADLPQQLSLF
jgi:hypothetical protein